MPQEKILKEAVQKGMKINVRSENFMAWSSMRTINNQLFNTIIFE